MSNDTVSNFTLVPVTRRAPKRAHPDITAGFSEKGALSLILSCEFLSGQQSLAVGSRVLVGYDAENSRLLITPASEDSKTSVRVIRKYPQQNGAGMLHISAQNLPENFPFITKRKAVVWEEAGEDGGVIVHLD